jgi:hypothetical protein
MLIGVNETAGNVVALATRVMPFTSNATASKLSSISLPTGMDIGSSEAVDRLTCPKVTQSASISYPYL